jgi:hypothetical protein
MVSTTKKILIKDNLNKKRLTEDIKCIFCDELETIDNFFIHRSIALCL